ncbi:putative serine/threonine-protein kinase [Hordeum vulgare]|uniref:non-specific serine/threonine protein kinase n=1 Tax=Hordeum vulgare subsp. vulgare TaxID=112509 RepID=A0A8I6WXK1_HORVV|nr:putative serine/threonine-protein kinase [Hordeum vulgare]
MRRLHSVPLLVAMLALSTAARAATQPPPDPGAYFRYTNCTPAPYQCGQVEFDLNYPFAVDGVARPDYCSSPGHRLFCVNNTLTIDLSTGASFQVTGVDYGNQALAVIDQSLAHEPACPHAYRNTTIDAAAFAYTDRDRFLTAYVNCTGDTRSSLPPVHDAFACVAGGRSYFMLDNGTSAPEDVLGLGLGVECSSILVVPYDSAMADALATGNATLGGAVRAGFTVRWKAGDGWCGGCQASGGRCGHDSRAPGDHTCFCPGGQVIGSCPSSSGPKKVSKKTITAIGSSAAALVLFLLLVVVSFLYIRKRRQYKMTSSSRLLKYSNSGGTPRSRGGSDLESDSVHNLQTHHFAYEELEEATGGFCDTRELGDGGFGTVYKGQLRDGRVVAVKRLYNNGCRHVEQFVNEAAILSRLRHPNLVTFYGCTSSRSRELLLVYEYVPNGTVADHLHGHRAGERALPWPLRLNVAVEAAAALAYLHAIEPSVVHRDVKTTNILLDADFHVKVADFGLSRLFPLDGATHVSTAPQGTPGYVDPEYHQCYQLTDRSDVYSFGVVLAELISSKPAVDVTRDRDEINLAAMAVGRIQRSELEQLVDAELGYGFDEATTKAMTMVAELAFRCLQQNSEMRPPIREVLDGLRGIQEGGAREKKYDVVVVPRSPNTVHAPWDSMSTTPSITSSA